MKPTGATRDNENRDERVPIYLSRAEALKVANFLDAYGEEDDHDIAASLRNQTQRRSKMKSLSVKGEARDLIQDCSNWWDIEHRILPRVEALINERERLREALRELTSAVIAVTTEGFEYGYLQRLREASSEAVALIATSSTSAGGG